MLLEGAVDVFGELHVFEHALHFAREPSTTLSLDKDYNTFRDETKTDR